MNKHFLVTISSETENLYGVKFLCSFFTKEAKHRLTLLHIYRKNQNDMSANLMEMWLKPDDAIKGRLTVGARIAIDKSAKLIKSSNMSIQQMVTKTVAEQFGKVKDILNEGHHGLYDAIILGKRASYTLQWLFERPADEIAQSIIKDITFTTPLWICPKIVPENSNVLICVDGSENSFRAVDHAGYILSQQKQHKLTLFHVKNKSEISGYEIFRRAEKILNEHGITDERIETISTWGISTVGTIMGILDRHHFAAVALGLRGSQKETLKDRQFAGTTASLLIQKVEHSAIWCCP